MPMKKGVNCKFRGKCEGCTPKSCPGANACEAYYNAYHAAYYQQNKERKDAYAKEQYKKPLVKVRNSIQKHVNNSGCTSEVDLDQAAALYEATTHCRYCGANLKDGSVLVSLDRINNETVIRNDNIQFICKDCNTTKGPRSHAEFIAYMKRALELNL